VFLFHREDAKVGKKQSKSRGRSKKRLAG